MIFNFYQKIGPAGVVILLIALIGFFISTRTYIYLLLVWREFTRDFLKIEKGCLRETCNRNPLAAIVWDIVKTHGGHSEDVRAEVAYLFYRNFSNVTHSLCWIKLISVVSPLLGLLGTVLGMVTVFQTIASEASPDATVLAAGIWEALVTTIMGLCVAIPILMCYYFLLLKFKEFHIEAVEHSYKALKIHEKIKPELLEEGAHV